ncbi:MAG: flagellar protein FlaG [Methyloprofundus sp.]|nr:flagellar protein FlaG [Methyloprofundus sp.]
MDIELNTISPSVAKKATDANPALTGSGSLPASSQQKQSQSVESAAKPAAETQPTDLQVLDSMNQRFDQLNIGLMFSVDQDTRTAVVKLVDKSTDEVVRQFPTEQSLRMVQAIQNYLNSVSQGDLQNNKGLTGVLINEII